MRLLAFFVLFSSAFSYAQDFQSEAKQLAADLKSSLMKNLSDKIAKDGVVKAVPFCHENVKLIAKKSASDRINKYEFGRTSHKLRNDSNKAQPWADAYLKEFQGTKKNDNSKEFILHTLDNGKKIYLEPLYVQAQCLTCHGENVSSEIKNQVAKLYPNDKATGFKLGEFRGFIWVKEK